MGPSLTASFVYDGLGRRTSRTVNAASLPYLYDGVDILREGVGIAAATYLRGLGVDEPFGRGTSEFYLTDALGSTVALTNAAGNLRATYSYEPFGRTQASGPNSTNPFQFTGRENDGTGLYYYRARYYHPGLARFLSEDPIGLLGWDVNLYQYVWSNPLAWTDALGLAVILLTRAGDWPDQAVVEKLGCLSDVIGRNVIITGGRDTGIHDPTGYHPSGLAADVNVGGMTSEQVAARAAHVSFTGIIVYGPPDRRGHTHVDLRPTEFNGYNGRGLPTRPPWRTEFGRYDCPTSNAQGRDAQ